MDGFTPMTIWEAQIGLSGLKKKRGAGYEVGRSRTEIDLGASQEEELGMKVIKILYNDVYKFSKI